MNNNLAQLTETGINPEQIKKIDHYLTTLSPTECWQKISTEILNANYPFSAHKLLYNLVYSDWDKIPAPAWFPSPKFVESTNLAQTMKELNLDNYEKFHSWSVNNYQDYWSMVLKKLNVLFAKKYSAIVDLTNGIENPNWLPDAQFNIVSSCFQASGSAIAIIHQTENGSLQQMTYRELDQLSNRVANSVSKHFKTGDAIGICMPMTAECVAIYLGIIKAGCVVVSIADSFSADEIATRLRITQAKGIFTQDCILRGEKRLPLYNRVKEANAPFAIVLPAEKRFDGHLRDNDQNWHDFLLTQDEFTLVNANAHAAINILFSSGTTGDPKAIPWNHTTAIKAAADAFFHQDIKSGDILAWPTNIGWMMGPWLIFAALLNRATIALYDGIPLGKSFGEFVQNSKVTMLGVVPSIVKAWRASACMEGLDWTQIKCFSSTGESSNVDDMLYLMSLANYRPIIEYCGGTEIGGAYITSTLVQPNAPAAFTTPTLGLDLILLDEQGNPTDNGEVALIPPSMGLSTELLNKDHYQVYFADMPKLPTGKILRRHGDQIQKFPNGFYRALGRVDDTMNLGAIKISSAEIERALIGVENVFETAAIAVNPKGGGPSQLVIYVVAKNPELVIIPELKTVLQTNINKYLNPLFKIHDVVLIDALPRTASNKVMRRVLRDRYQQTNQE